jgi:hypothetical protein
MSIAFWLAAALVDAPIAWTTPVSRVRTFAAGPRLPGYGEGWWHPPEGGFAHLRIELDDITCNVEAI